MIIPKKNETANAHKSYSINKKVSTNAITKTGVNKGKPLHEF